ncbi:MAG: YitT family protein [Bacillales bacterium]|nr:YitT family protein [Bacillales bacterium]
MESAEYQKLSKKSVLINAFFITLGAALMAVGLEIFLVPNHIIDGGITGISIILSHLLGLKLGIFLFILNIPFFVIGYKQLGKRFTISILYGIIVLSLFTFLLTPVARITHDILLAAVFGGITIGIGVGLVIRFGGALDGTEILAILISSKTALSVGQIVLFFNIFILGSAGFVFGWDHAMYSLIAYFIAFKMIDIVVEGLEQSRSVWIISDRDTEIGEALLTHLGRGVTYLNGEGGYKGTGKKIIFCVINRLEEAQLKSIVDQIDPNAFLAIGEVAEVKGGQFKKRGIH